MTSAFSLARKQLIKTLAVALPLCIAGGASAQSPRQTISLNEGWHSLASDSNQSAGNGFETASYNDKNWKTVTVPHNWDQYEGYRRMKHGNRHGYSWYRRSFTIKKDPAEHCYFLFFEGVGSYATVWLNGKKVGYHAGGRTSFTLDVTNAIRFNATNLLAVRADHPSFIQDLPWVCGGCSEEVGFSEGSQPMGIFRPVSLLVTASVRIAPFGVHIWNDTTVTEQSAQLHLETEVKNYGNSSRAFTIVNRLKDASGKVVSEIKTSKTLTSGVTATLAQELPLISNPHLWSLQSPYLYTLESQILEAGKLVDAITTPYGIRWVKWDINRKDSTSQFYVNGKSVFINGTAEYEHLMGKSHAFSDAEVDARIAQTKAAGYNAFRDAHQPHNLRYQNAWDKMGILWWPQFSAHIWYDKPEFRENFKTLLRDWVKERRNSPSNILWGLENESKLPKDFAEECSRIIRELDPTASSQRKITTCNGGSGTDWDVPQNWTGTYGGNPAMYAEDVQRQQLIGEYGAWRTLDLHTEGAFAQNGPLSEDRMTTLMETKIRLAESVRDKTCGQFHWLLYSHENPGRAQSGEGFREMDRIGPVNYKGLFTAWGEPTDAFYMFRSNYAPKETEPMVYIVSHTWPDRWATPGVKDSIIVYSNCDEVELFNDKKTISPAQRNGFLVVEKLHLITVGVDSIIVYSNCDEVELFNDKKTISLGRRKRNGIGTHFQWDGVNIQYNTLYAVGYVNGKVVAEDGILLHHLPQVPNQQKAATTNNILQPANGYNYIYRVNCGGAEYKDALGNTWQVDVHQTGSNTWGSTSWTDAFPGISPFFASQRKAHIPIAGTNDADLFQSYRYGQDQLKYEFPVPDGDYLVDLFFTEPWYGIGGGMNCEGWRLFDVAVNDKVVLHNLDIWKEAGTAKSLKKTITAHVTGGKLTISFPNIAAGQAIISAIAIASTKGSIQGAAASSSIIHNLSQNAKSSGWSVQAWMDTGDKPFSDAAETFSVIPSSLYGATWLRSEKNATGNISFKLNEEADVYAGISDTAALKKAWLKGFSPTGSYIQTDAKTNNRFAVYRKRMGKNTTITIYGGNTSRYVIAATPVTTIDPAFDLKPTISYKVDKASLSGAVRDSVQGRACVTLKKPGDVLTWTISVGVADQYALRYKFFNPTEKPIAATIKVLAADGSLMKEGPLSFGPAINSKWGGLNTTTGTSINAGEYRVILTLQESAPLSISSLEVQ